MKNRLQLLISKLKATLDKLLPKLPKFDGNCPLRKVLGGLAFVMLSGYLVINAPQMHGQYLRAKVGSRVYKIQAQLHGGGGTGFAFQAPSGESYIITNSHVCDSVLAQTNIPNTVLVVNDEGAMPRRVLAISGESDLCLIEGIPGVTGLSLGSEASVGEIVASIGHPLLRPLTISRGEVIAKEDIEILSYVLPTGNIMLDAALNARAGKCDLPKNRLIEEEITIMGPDGLTNIKVRLCINITKDAIATSMVIYPGNSGSPMVNFWGNIVGVMFAGDQRSNYGDAVSLQDLKNFIARY